MLVINEDTLLINSTKEVTNLDRIIKYINEQGAKI